jgi:hypothetical protein
MFSNVEIKVPKHDLDLTLIFRNGATICLQWREETASLDICLPEDKMPVNCWEGQDLTPAKGVDGQKHVRLCGQICIDMGPKYLKKKKDDTRPL